jgi:hypothetical protein
MSRKGNNNPPAGRSEILVGLNREIELENYYSLTHVRMNNSNKKAEYIFVENIVHGPYTN